MGALLGALAAVAYGAADFAAGVASRRLAPGPVTVVVQALGLVAVVLVVLVVPVASPSAAELGWGALSGVGSGTGSLCLYHGLAVGRMSVVATVSAVLTAVLPAIVGVVLGDDLSGPAVTGIVIAIAAIGLVSWHPDPSARARASAGLGYGLLAGVGFALLLIALDQAGSGAGAWPLVPGQAVAVLLVLPFGRGALRSTVSWRPVALPALAAGLLGGTAGLLFLAASGQGQLAVVAVLTSLYPAVTVLLARVLLAEHWTRTQAVGLLTAAAAVTLISLG